MTESPQPFDDQTTAFSLSNALHLGFAARLTYEPQDVVAEAVEGWGFDRFQFFDHADTQGFVAGNDQRVFVAFRGTEPDNLQDWLVDARMRLTGGPLGGRVHRGFLGALLPIWGPVEELVHDWSRNGQSLWMAGHSLGGAMAVLSAAMLAEDAHPINGVYTFGQPRIGDETFARHFDQVLRDRTYRIVNDIDIVPRMPPRRLGYRHVGTLRFLNEEGQLQDTPSGWFRLLNLVRAKIEDLSEIGSASVDAHDSSRYVQAIKALMA